MIREDDWKGYPEDGPPSDGDGDPGPLPPDLDRDDEPVAAAAATSRTTRTKEWGKPDMAVLALNRRKPRPSPPDRFGSLWPLVVDVAAGTGAPVDYDAVRLLAVAASFMAAVRSVVGMVARPRRPRGCDDTRALDYADVRAVPGGADAIRATFGGCYEA